jgi:hypothetical protein
MFIVLTLAAVSQAAKLPCDLAWGGVLPGRKPAGKHVQRISGPFSNRIDLDSAGWTKRKGRSTFV